MMTKTVPCFECRRPVEVTGPDLTELDGDLCPECLDPEPPCPHRWTDFGALECWSGNCYQAAAELLDAIRSQPPVPSVHPNGYGLWWELNRLWLRLSHCFG